MPRRAYSYAGFRIRYVLLTAFFSAYVGVAFAGYFFSPYREYYPVFSWSLFSQVPDLRTQLEVVVHRIGDREFDPPVPYERLGDEFPAARGRDSGPAKSVGRLGRALIAMPERVDAQRRVTEAWLFDNRSDVEYELRLVAFRPLERWRDGTTVREKTIGRFRTGESR